MSVRTLIAVAAAAVFLAAAAEPAPDVPTLSTAIDEGADRDAAAAPDAVSATGVADRPAEKPKFKPKRVQREEAAAKKFGKPCTEDLDFDDDCRAIFRPDDD